MKKRIIIILGSVNDLKQCRKGLEWLRVNSKIVDARVYVRSAHRHTTKLLWLLDSLCAMDEETESSIVIIAGAGKAAALPGLVDGYLRNAKQNTRIHVIGVAFETKEKIDNDAAVLSITQVPGTQISYAGQGVAGFSKACVIACGDDLPENHLTDVPPTQDLSLERALELAEQQ